MLVDALRALGCDVVVLPWGRRRDDESRTEKVRHRIEEIAAVRRALRISTFDLLLVKTAHDWSTFARDIPLLLATRGLVRHRVMQFHGSDSDRLVAPGRRLFKAATRALLGLSDAALVLSRQEQAEWRAFYPAGRFHVVRNPFRPDPDDPASEGRPAVNVPRAKPVLLFVGRLLEAKGVFELVACLPAVRRCVDCQLVFVGDGPAAERLRAEVASLGLTGAVRFAGYREGAALRAAYRAADIFVLPSWTEGFPFVINEALDAGLPIVTTRLRGMADHLEHGVNALLVPPRDPERLGVELLRLLSDPDLRARMSTANREKSRAFSPPIVAREFLTALQAIDAGVMPEDSQCAG